MKAIVTGGAGFIGSHIVDLLIQMGFDVVIIDSLMTELNHVNKHAKLYEIDIGHPRVEEIFKIEKPTYVFHLAAQVDVNQSIVDPVGDASINILGTLNILKCCVEYSVSKVIYSSSSAVYGESWSSSNDEHTNAQPISFYGLSKCVPEMYLNIFSKIHGLNYTILRYSNVYGDRQGYKAEGGVVPSFIRALLLDESLTILGSGLQTRDFIYVKDVAAANIAALSKADNETLNISSFSSTTINDLLNELNVLMNKNVTPIYKKERKGDIMHSLLNNEKAIKQLGWIPKYPLKEGLTKTINYYQTTMNKHLV